MTKVKAITVDIAKNTNTQKTIFRALIACLMLLSVVYGYLIGSITFNILARKSLETTVRSLSTNVSNLELEYLNKTNKIDKQYANSLGFVNANDNIFVTRSVSSVAIR